MSGAVDSSQAAPPSAASPPSKRDLKSWWKGFKLPSKHQEPSVRNSDCKKTPTPRFIPSNSSGNSKDAHVAQRKTVSSSDATASSAEEPFAVGKLPRSRRSSQARRDHSSQSFLDATTEYVKAKQFLPDIRPQGIFGVPLRQSITYANVAISLIDENGKSYIYGYVPIVVAKCGVFLKEKATGVEGIFRLSGSEKRIKELKHAFDSPDRYGKGLVWDGYTVHDAANVLRRYLNDLPEPVVPLDLYQRFREPLKGATKQAVGDAEGPQLVDDFDEQAAIVKYQHLITELPPLNRQLLLYILDLLAVFAAKSDENRMTSQNLAAIFQPGMLSHPEHAMAPEEYRLNQCVIIFLIENQDHFLIGMQGTATDEKTKQEIEKGTPPISGQVTPNPNKYSGVGRSASNASAGAESVRREGKLRRNRSVSSRHSRQEGATTPNSPGLIATPTSGLGRSNTVPSKKSPHVQSGRFYKGEISPMASPKGPALQEALSPSTQNQQAENRMSPAPSSTAGAAIGASSLAPGSGAGGGRSQERLLEPPQETLTPQKERNLQSIFQRSPSGEAEKRQPNKLKKKKIPGSVNPSAHSSSTSLQGAHSPIPSPNFEAPNPLEPPTSIPENSGPDPPATESTEPQSDSTPRASQVPPGNTLHPDNNLKATKSPPQSVHSSFNGEAEVDRVEEPTNNSTAELSEKEKKSRWRLSRGRKDEASSVGGGGQASPRLGIGSNTNAGVSATSIGSSGNRPRPSFTGESSDPSSSAQDVMSGSSEQREGRDDSKGPIGWIRNKYREAKETAELRRAKSPPADSRQSSGLSAASLLATRPKSFDMKREEQKPAAPAQSQPQPQARASNATSTETPAEQPGQPSETHNTPEKLSEEKNQ